MLIKPEIVPATMSNTRNFVTANGNSLDTIGLNEDHNGLISSNSRPVGIIADADDGDVDDVDTTGMDSSSPRLSRFCSWTTRQKKR